MKRRKVLLTLAVALIPLLITAQAQTNKPIISIPDLIGKSPSEVEKVVGKPKERTPITNEPDQMPGEFRDYKIKGAQPGLTLDGLMIRFYKGKAVHITVDLPQPQNTAEAALRQAGIDVGDTPPTVRAPRGHGWEGTIGGVSYKNVVALKAGGDKSKFSTVQATLSDKQ